MNESQRGGGGKTLAHSIIFLSFVIMITRYYDCLVDQLHLKISEELYKSARFLPFIMIGL